VRTRGLFRAAGLLGAIFAGVGVLAAVLGAAIGGDLSSASVGPLVVLAAALLLAGAMIAVIAALAEWWLRGMVPDAESRHTWASMIAAGMVLASGLMSVGSLGVLAFAVTGMLAIVTQQVLYRTLG